MIAGFAQGLQQAQQMQQQREQLEIQKLYAAAQAQEATAKTKQMDIETKLLQNKLKTSNLFLPQLEQELGGGAVPSGMPAPTQSAQGFAPAQFTVNLPGSQRIPSTDEQAALFNRQPNLMDAIRQVGERMGAVRAPVLKGPSRVESFTTPNTLPPEQPGPTAGASPTLPQGGGMQLLTGLDQQTKMAVLGLLANGDVAGAARMAQEAHQKQVPSINRPINPQESLELGVFNELFPQKGEAFIATHGRAPTVGEVQTLLQPKETVLWNAEVRKRMHEERLAEQAAQGREAKVIERESESLKPAGKESDNWLDPDTLRPAPPSTPNKDLNQGYVHIDNQQKPGLKQVQALTRALGEVEEIGNRIMRRQSGKSWLDAIHGGLQIAKFKLADISGDPDIKALRSALSRVTVPFAKLQGDTANIAVAERMIVTGSISDDTDSFESLLTKIQSIRDGLRDGLTAQGFNGDKLVPESAFAPPETPPEKPMPPSGRRMSVPAPSSSKQSTPQPSTQKQAKPLSPPTLADLQGFKKILGQPRDENEEQVTKRVMAGEWSPEDGIAEIRRLRTERGRD